MAQGKIWTRLLIVFLASLLALMPVGVLAQPQQSSPPAKRKLVVAVMAAPPFSMQDDDGSWSGITVELWKEIASVIGVDYEFKTVNLEGLLKGLENGSIDVGATGLSISSAREQKFDFSTPYLSASEVVAVNADQQPNLFQVFRAAFFNWNLLTVVLCLVLFNLFGAAILWLLESKGKSEHYKGKTKKAFGHSLFWSTMTLAGKELPRSVGWITNSPETVPGRLFAMAWMVVGVMLISLFTATAASVLTSRQLQGIVNSAEDLRRVKCGTVKGSIGSAYLDKHHINCDHLYASPVDMLKALSEHQYDAAVYNSQIMSYYARTAFTNKIVVLRFSLRQDFLAIPLKPGSDLRKSINKAMLQVLESKRWQEIVVNYVGND